MIIGFIGLGKLGLPVALAVEAAGHKVIGHDVNPAVADYLAERKIPFVEKDIQPLLDKTEIELVGVGRLVAESDIIFCAVQTPHDPKFEGATRIPEERRDFDYSWLKDAVHEVAQQAFARNKQTTLVVISTCLPGTFNREIRPLLNKRIDYVYNPFFIAMGTVIDDFLNPEFVLLGSEKPLKNHPVKWLYESLHDRPFMETDITTAEAIKVSYNTFITMKTVLANTWGELAHKLGANVDDIHKAWSMATERLISPRYLRAGMGDGGGCHPRDNIALSHIAKEVGLSHDIFEDLMLAREDHAEWLASIISDGAVIFGRSFKPETNIETGSPALLVASIMAEQGKTFIHEEDPIPGQFNFIATQHARYKDIKWPEGSTVIDPFGYIQDQPGVNVVRLGRLTSAPAY